MYALGAIPQHIFEITPGGHQRNLITSFVLMLARYRTLGEHAHATDTVPRTQSGEPVS